LINSELDESRLMQKSIALVTTNNVGVGFRNLIFNGDTRSPSPVYEGTPSIWHLAKILTWLREAKTY
jgi:hypothetical protein